MSTMSERDAAQSEGDVDFDEHDRSSPPIFAFNLTAADFVCVVVAGLMLVAFVPSLTFASWTPRASLLFLIGLPGVVVLVRRALSRDRVALTAAAFLVVVLVSALLSSAPRSSVVGFAGRDLSVLTLASAFGVWAIARGASPFGRQALLVVFATVGSAVAAIGILQVTLGIDSGALALHEGRPSSFLINPVYFGAVCGAVAVVAVRSASDRPDWCHVAAFVASAGCVLSGSRVAWAALVVLVVAAVVRDRDRTQATAAGAGALGAVAAFVLDSAVSGGSGTFDRVSGATPAGGGGRWSVWEYAMQSWSDRPVLGHGVGLFRPSIQSRFTPDFARAAGPGELERVWFDAHNVFIAVLVATGVIGLAVFVGWLAFVGSRARGPLAWAALAIALTWLLQPVAIHTLPLAMVLLGASMPEEPAPARPTARVRAAFVASAACSLAIASSILIADLGLQRAADSDSYPAAVAASRWMPGDSVVASLVAQVARFDSDTTSPNARSLEWRRQTVEREPDRPFWWNELATEHLQLGDIEAAEIAIDQALNLQPVNFRGNVLRLEISVRRGDREAVESQLDVLCELNPDGCDLTADDVMVNR